MQSSSKISFGIIFFVMIFVITVHLTILDFKFVNAQQKESEIIEIKKPNLDEKDELVVSSNINLQNIPKTGMLKVVGVINGEGFIKDIPLYELDETTNKLKVNFVMNKENEFVSAGKPDEFFVCAYHFTNPNYNTNNNKYNKINSIDFDEQQHNQPNLEYFDCNEGDITSTTTPTQVSLFSPNSLVYDKSAYYYNMHSQQPPSQETSFDTIGNDDNSAATINAREEDAYSDNYSDSNSNKPVKVKIIVPMEDRKNAEKIKIMAMLKGQIKSEVIEDVQKRICQDWWVYN